MIQVNKTELVSDVDEELLDNPEEYEGEEMKHYKNPEEMAKMFATGEN